MSFIGSNSALVAPVKIGDGANIAAGSVITRDVRGRCARDRARAAGKVETGWARSYRDAQAAPRQASEESRERGMCGIVGILGNEPVARRHLRSAEAA